MKKQFFAIKAFLPISIVFFMLSACNKLNAETTEATKITENTESAEEKDITDTELINEAIDEDYAVPAMAETKVPSLGDDIPVSRGLVAKMLTLTFNDINSIDTLNREIQFKDTSVDKWYDKYINAAYVNKFMQGINEENFMPEQAITLSQAQMLLDNINKNNKVKVQLTEETKDKPISYALWAELYQKFLQGTTGDKSINELYGIEEKNYIILATPENNPMLNQWNMITDKGPISFVGLNMNMYLDKEIKVLEKDHEIIAILSVVNESPSLKNTLVVKNTAENITIFTGGAERTYIYENEFGDIKGSACDITIENGAAREVSVFSEKTNDFIMSTGTQGLETKTGDFLELHENFKVYSFIDDIARWKNINNIIVGTDIADIIMRDGKAYTAIINKNVIPKDLRVAINTTGFNGLYHNEAIFTSETPFSIRVGENKKSFLANETLEINDEMFAGKPRMYIEPDMPDGRMKILNIKRNTEGISPKYRGTVEVSKTSQGYCIVNIIDIEEYLYSVVPSEMPSSYGLEAAKVQAVTARSYAYNQFFANRYHAYGGNVDDSVSCQVYNNTAENENSIESVNATKGMCLTYNGDVISANFFSTSSGVTANNGEVWGDNDTKQFPTATKEYLKSTKQYVGDDFGDLSQEANASKFFKDTTIKAFDSDVSWFRWQTELTAEEISASINANISGRYRANPTYIKTLEYGNIYKSKPIETIGSLKTLEVVKRGEGGNIMAMKVVGTEATIMIYTEYNIRALIAPKNYIQGNRDILLTRKDGSTVANYSLMPSSFYTMERMTLDDGQIVTVKFFGGGNGHGSGMSQNGVKGMIDAGYKFNEILTHFYPKTEIKVMY